MLDRSDIKHLLAGHCVRLNPSPDQHRIVEMREWCLRQLGEERPSFPIDEAAYDGYIDYFDGDWCQISTRRYSADGNTETIFWFWSDSDRARFQLTCL